MGKLLPACTQLPHPNHTLATLRSIQLTQTNQRQFYSWQPRHRYRHRPLLPCLGCLVAYRYRYSIYSIGGQVGGCYTCYIVYYTIVLHSVLDANFGI